MVQAVQAQLAGMQQWKKGVLQGVFVEEVAAETLRREGMRQTWVYGTLGITLGHMCAY